jgi:hypothetical protein
VTEGGTSRPGDAPAPGPSPPLPGETDT